MFVVADSLAKAKTRAVKQAKGWRDPHRDDIYEAEQAFCLSEMAQAHQLFIHLTPNAVAQELRFICDYMPIRARR